MTLKNRKVLVTGADGFIGSHLVEELVKAGARVRAFVYYNSFNSCGWLDTLPKEVFESLEIFSGDIRDPNGVRKACADIEIVFHLAALIGIPYSYHSPDTYIDTNIKGTLNVLQAARDLGVEHVLHTSTSEVYGTAQFVPITEEHPLQGQSPYSASKIGADQLALSFYRSFNTAVTVIRPFNTYGPRQSARAIIPTIITQIASGKKKIQIGDLTPTRDFSFVLDTARGFIAAAGNSQSFGEVVNLGSGFEISVGETATLIQELMSTSVELCHNEERIRPAKSEVGRLWADNSKAKRLVGWQPSYGALDGFKKGLQETIEWFAKPENLARYKTGIYNV
jgi:NAD dependent epimerase/dehydratase